MGRTFDFWCDTSSKSFIQICRHARLFTEVAGPLGLFAHTNVVSPRFIGCNCGSVPVMLCIDLLSSVVFAAGMLLKCMTSSQPLKYQFSNYCSMWGDCIGSTAAVFTLHHVALHAVSGFVYMTSFNLV